MDRYLILLVLLTSCSAHREFSGTHYEARKIESEFSIESLMRTIEVKGTKRIIEYYDTSRAKETEKGFVSPVMIRVEEEMTDSTHVMRTDTIQGITKEEVSIEEEVHETKDIKTGKNVSLGIGLLLCVCVMFLWKRFSSR